MSKNNPTSNEEMIQMAQKAVKAGNKQGARMMFEQVYKRDKRNERALLGLAQVASNPRERQKWLRRVLKVNPGNETAQVALKKLERRYAVRENRTLLIWGSIALVLFVIVVAVLLLVLFSGRVA